MLRGWNPMLRYIVAEIPGSTDVEYLLKKPTRYACGWSECSVGDKDGLMTTRIRTAAHGLGP